MCRSSLNAPSPCILNLCCFSPHVRSPILYILDHHPYPSLFLARVCSSLSLSCLFAVSLNSSLTHTNLNVDLNLNLSRLQLHLWALHRVLRPTHEQPGTSSRQRPRPPYQRTIQTQKRKRGERKRGETKRKTWMFKNVASCVNQLVGVSTGAAVGGRGM